MNAAFTNEALENAIKNCQQQPKVFNTDQGSQFKSPERAGKLESLGIRVSMDGKILMHVSYFHQKTFNRYRIQRCLLEGIRNVMRFAGRIARMLPTLLYMAHSPSTEKNLTPKKAYPEDDKGRTEAEAAEQKAQRNTPATERL